MTEPKEKQQKYANTPMSDEFFEWVTNRAWELRLTRAEYIRSLIEDRKAAEATNGR